MKRQTKRLDENVAILAAARAFELARELELEGLVELNSDRLQCCVKLDGVAVVWAGRDLEDARLAGFYGHVALELDLTGKLTPAGASRLLLILGTARLLVGLRAPPLLVGFHDGDSRPFGAPFREVRP